MHPFLALSAAKLARFAVAMVEKLPECRGGIEPQGVTPFRELDDVETSLTTLDLRHEGLRIPDLFGQRRLRVAGFVAQLHEKVQEGTVMPMVG